MKGGSGDYLNSGLVAIGGVDGSPVEPPDSGTYLSVSPDHVSKLGLVGVNVRTEKRGQLWAGCAIYTQLQYKERCVISHTFM